MVRWSFVLISIAYIIKVAIAHIRNKGLPLLVKLAAIPVFFGMASFADMYWFEPYWIRTEKVVIKDSALASVLSGIKMIQISDIHIGNSIGYRERQLIEKVNALNPDIIFITGDFFRIFRLPMALAGRRRLLFGLFPLLPHTLAVTAGLLAAALLAPLARPVPPRRKSSCPKPCRFRAGFAAIPRPRMKGRKPLLAPLQKTDPRTAMDRGLPSRRTAIMLKMDHGSCCSRRSSPGAELPSPLRDASESLLPVHSPSVQLNQTDPRSPRSPSP